MRVTQKENGRGHALAAEKDISTRLHSIMSTAENVGAFPTLAPRLIAAGYIVVPITPGKKYPALTAWQSARLTTADAHKFPGRGTGVLTGQGDFPIVAFDVDSVAPALVEGFVAWCRTNLGETVERVGNAPKRLLVYRAAESGWRKRESPWFDDDAGNEHRLEVLGMGQQFVAYHVHPDTGRPYEWTDLFGGAEHVPAADLPIVTAQQVAGAIAEFERLAEAAGFVRRTGAAPAAPRATERAPREPGDFFGRVNDAAMRNLAAWVPALLPAARPYHGGFRVAQSDLGRPDLEEDLSIVPEGIKDFGMHDMGDSREGKRTPIDLVIEWAHLTMDDLEITQPIEAARWFCEQLEIEPEALGCRGPGAGPDMTDAGNAAVLLAGAEGNLRFIVERRAWIAWDGERWTLDDAGTASMGAAFRVAGYWTDRAQEIAKQAEAATGPDRKRLLTASEGFRKWAANCRSRRGLEAMLALATRDERAVIRAAELDRDPNLLGVESGVVDLRTGELRPAGRDDYITRRAPVRYTPGASAPRWERFIEEITAAPDPTSASGMRPRPAVASFLRRVLGYAATGLTREHKLFIAVGGGANGKSLLFDVLASVLGPYFYALPPEAMMASQRESDPERPTPFARGLEGARFAVGSEAREGQQLSSAWVKRMTGDAKVTARGLHENARTFDATHALFLLTNHQPPMDHLDGATRGRVICLPFDMAWNRPGVVDRDPTRPDGDKDLMRKLRDESEGILAWLVRASVDYFRDGLDPPDEVRNKTTDYFQDQDAFARWMTECERCEPRDGTAAAELLAHFDHWCFTEGVHDRRASNATAFAAALKGAGIADHRAKRGKSYGLRWVGPPRRV